MFELKSEKTQLVFLNFLKNLFKNGGIAIKYFFD